MMINIVLPNSMKMPSLHFYLKKILEPNLFNHKNKITMQETMMSSQDLMKLEDIYGAHNYHPLPVVLAKGEGVYVQRRRSRSIE